MVRKAVIVVAFAVCAFVGAWQLSKARSFQLMGELVDRVEIEQKLVALTFDDGPDPHHTDQMLAVLARYRIAATFFVVGAEVERFPGAARRLVEAGHELGNHSWSHRRMVFRSQAFIRDEIERTDAAIRHAGFVGDILFRPPYGKKLVGLPWFLSRTARITVMWDIEPESDPAVAADAGRIAAHVLERVRPGSIILLHAMYPSRETTRQALPAIIEGLQQQGYELVTVSDLLAHADGR